jgi:dATP/dGTP diphosphohydrolase/recombination endonuclease VII
MPEPKKFASCHPDQLNYWWGRCETCYKWMRDPTAPCPHDDRPKDRHGRCDTCVSRWYRIRRLNGVGDKFGTVRSSRTEFRDIHDPELRRKLYHKRRRLRAYNLSLSDYESILERQGGVCAICRQPPGDDVELSVDHDQRCCPAGKSCGKCVRGLLCHGCNMRLGQLESGLVTRSIDYLLRDYAGALAPHEEKVVVDPNTGGRKATKLARFDLISPRGLWELAEVYGRGSLKYEADNWMRGYKWSLSFSALMRHALAFWSGQARSDDNNHHMACVAWHAFALIEFEALGLGKDDRPFRKLLPVETKTE